MYVSFFFTLLADKDACNSAAVNSILGYAQCHVTVCTLLCSMTSSTNPEIMIDLLTFPTVVYAAEVCGASQMYTCVILHVSALGLCVIINPVIYLAKEIFFQSLKLFVTTKPSSWTILHPVRVSELCLQHLSCTCH